MAGSRSFDDALVELFDLSPDAFCIAGFDGYLKRVNPAFPRGLGYTVEQLLERPFLEHIHPADRESVQALMAGLAAGNPVVGLECRHICADGSARWFEWSVSSRPDAGVVYGVGRDVTERRIANDELSALRHIATLAAEGEAQADLFAVVAEEVARVVDIPIVTVVRYEPDNTLTVCATFPKEPKLFPAGTRLSMDSTRLGALVRESPTAVRIEDYSQLDGEIAASARGAGVRSTIGVPIVVAGRHWGAMSGWTTGPEPLPDDAAARLARFNELLATAIANAETREALARLAAQQAALRRIATLVARGTPPSEVFAVVAEEVAHVVDVPFVIVARYDGDWATDCASYPPESGISTVGTRWSLDGTNVMSLVRQRVAPARIDDYSQLDGQIANHARDVGLKHTVGVPILVAGRLWGVMIASTGYPLPGDTEERLARFTELVATAIANAESREALARLAEQQAALRRIATLVARSTPPSEVFAAVADEMARCLGTTDAEVLRSDPDGSAVVVAAHVAPGGRALTVGERLPLDGDSVTARVLRTGRPARLDNYDHVEGTIAARNRELGPRSRVGAPIIVDEQVWGVALVGASAPVQLPSDTEERITEFADLVATAIANTAARSQLHASQDELRMLAEQQASLRRVATLVARGTSPEDLFAMVAEEVTRVVDVPFAIVVRYEDDDTATDCASFPPSPEVSTAGMRWSLGGTNVRSLVRKSSAPARIDDYSQLDGELANHARRVGYNSSAGVPITVAGRLWGAMIVSTSDPLPGDTEERLARFTELLATAIANAESREALGRLAEQQAGLRRVATLVARATQPAEIFDAVVDEMRRCMDAMTAGLWRFETTGELTLLAGAAGDPALLAKWPVGTRTPVEGNTLASMVQRTGRPARMDDYENVAGAVADRVRTVGVRAAVGVPVIVDECMWGLAAVGSIDPGPLPPDTEARMSDFADLVATSIANAATRDELLASRARIVAAGDDARRRIERDLHDGAQQRLVALGLELRAAEASVPEELQPLKDQISGLVSVVSGVSAEVQEISRGLHPAVLSRGGLAPALKALARRCTVPTALELKIDRRLPDSVEVGAYYVVAEALTNAAKHAQASAVEVCAHATNNHLRLEIRDDGIGGAARDKGSGLTGLADRVEALRGEMTIQSPPGRGTSLLVTIPVESD